MGDRVSRGKLSDFLKEVGNLTFGEVEFVERVKKMNTFTVELPGNNVRCGEDLY